MRYTTGYTPKLSGYIKKLWGQAFALGHDKLQEITILPGEFEYYALRKNSGQRISPAIRQSN
ncbi:MAG: hypothetical protein LBB84_04410, partial [Tannerellaceae bacterium]|nr:hypothetical protein [Tannerellaceae bacterium]